MSMQTWQQMCEYVCPPHRRSKIHYRVCKIGCVEVDGVANHISLSLSCDVRNDNPDAGVVLM